MNLELLSKKSLEINRIHHKGETNDAISGLAGVLQSYVMLFSAYNLSFNMKIREHYIKFTGNINNTYIINKSSNMTYVSKTTKAVQFYP